MKRVAGVIALALLLVISVVAAIWISRDDEPVRDAVVEPLTPTPTATPTATPGIEMTPTVTPTGAPVPSPTPVDVAEPRTGLRVDGPDIVDENGDVVRLRGVNRSGTEYACIQELGFHATDFPSDENTVQAIGSWGANAVRVPLNEHCWLDRNGAPAEYSGHHYQEEIDNWVSLLTDAGLYVILELHWTGAGSTQALGQQPMPNRDHSVDFWRRVAERFANHPQVIYDLFNEPYPDNNQDTAEAWRCLRDGGQCAGLDYDAAGMQELLDAIREAGADNLVLVGGVQHSNSLTQWLEYQPTDPVQNVAAKWHTYDFNWHVTAASWEETVRPVASLVPLIATEVGGPPDYVDEVVSWLEGINASYLFWSWNIFKTEHDLIADQSGTPTEPYGELVRQHLRSRLD
jgi:endoglucanase